MGSVRARPSDLISSLPDDVKESILMCLPTRDVVRTSILSKQWRYSWAKLPQLIIDETLWRDLVVKHPARITLTTILYHLLLLHEGPIKKFTLSVRTLESCTEINNLIYFLSRNGIEDLTLEMWKDDFYKFPVFCFTCGQLSHLRLRSCLFGATPAFRGFSSLITLKLYLVKIAAKVLGDLVSNCPLLELLELRYIIFTSSGEVEIDTPNLKTFTFIGLIHTIILKNVPRLSSVEIEPLENEGASSNLIKFLDNMPVLEKCSLAYLGEYLGARVTPERRLSKARVPRRLLATLVYLKDLRLSQLFLGCDHLLFILCLIRSSPNLKRIEIEIEGFTSTVEDANDTNEFLKEQDFSDIMLNELKEVRLEGVSGTRLELELIKLLLGKSPSLEKMLLIQTTTENADKRCEILKELIKFRRASKEVEVTCVD